MFITVNKRCKTDLFIRRPLETKYQCSSCFLLNTKEQWKYAIVNPESNQKRLHIFKISLMTRKKYLQNINLQKIPCY